MGISIAPESQAIVYNNIRVEGVGWMPSENGLLPPYYVARSTIHALGRNRQKNCLQKQWRSGASDANLTAAAQPTEL